MSTNQGSSFGGRIPDHELTPIVERILQESGAQNLTVSDVLYEKHGAEVRSLAVQFWKKEQAEKRAAQQSEEARQQREVEQKKAAEAARVSAMLREKLGLKPLTPEQLQEQMGNGKVAGNIFPASSIPETVVSLNEKFGKTLLSDAFTNDRRAVTFRGWLAYWHKKLSYTLRDSGLAPEYREALEDLGRKMKVIFDAATEVVAAWGLDPKTARTSPEEFNKLRGELEVEGSKFYWLTQAPKVETPEEKTAREQEQAAKDAERRIFEDLVGKLKARLLEVNSGMDEGAVDKMAKRLAIKHGKLQNISDMFTTAAINKMMSANGNEFEQQVAKTYAKAAGMTDESFEATISALRQKAADEAQAKAEEARKAKAHEGVMKPETIAAHASKNKGKKDGQKNGKSKK